ncbi:MAG: hypothetical protein GC129_06950 [Proteobacteria bacterium]|nr:hypothetical protein [Pseudomonadota bacterium]
MTEQTPTFTDAEGLTLEKGKIDIQAIVAIYPLGITKTLQKDGSWHFSAAFQVGQKPLLKWRRLRPFIREARCEVELTCPLSPTLSDAYQAYLDHSFSQGANKYPGLWAAWRNKPSWQAWRDRTHQLMEAYYPLMESEKTDFEVWGERQRKKMIARWKEQMVPRADEGIRLCLFPATAR